MNYAIWIYDPLPMINVFESMTVYILHYKIFILRKINIILAFSVNLNISLKISIL